MFDDPELPDFDSMSQEELIEWLEQLAKSRGGDGGLGAGETDPPGDPNLLDDDADAAPSLDWLDEIAAAQNGDDFPDSDSPATEARTAANPRGLPDADDDLLDWLEALDANGVTASSSWGASYAVDFPEDFDETWEDDETLDDLEDESLFSPKSAESTSFLESLAGLQDREAEQHSTQSMAPAADAAPADKAEPQENGLAPSARSDDDDSLTSAFLIQQRDADLEAWYAERLRAIKPDEAPADQPAPIKTGKPPPPGLAAAIYSARGKVKAGNLVAALRDYETLLGATAGLQWVAQDMRALIAQEQYRDKPAPHRVLGDALMRQGHLDAALKVYRHALSLL